MNSTPAGRLPPSGFILLTLLLVLFVAGSSLMLSTLNSRQDITFAQQTEVRYQLEKTKQRLLAYAASTHMLTDNDMGPGFFPCPDTDDDGIAEGSCNSTSTVRLGRLPYYVDNGAYHYELDRTYADVDQQFWYAVAPRYVYHSTAKSNRQSYYRTSATESAASNYRMTLDGENGYVILLLAPGEAIAGQDRASNTNEATNYLEGSNGIGGFTFNSYDIDDPDAFNDIVVGITLDEYVKAVAPRVVEKMKEALDAYHVDHGGYPNVSSFTGNQRSRFRNLFNNDFDWLKQSNRSGNGERWSNYSLYRRGSADSADIMFATYSSGSYQGCPGIFYTVTFSGGISRNGNSCTSP